MDRANLISQLSPPLDGVLVGLLLDEFVSMERRYVLADWEPTTLDGGQLAEVASRIVYHADSGNLNRRKGLDGCLAYVEDETNQNSHAISPRRTALHLSKVLRTIYKFRSQRGAVHIDPDYTANELDSTMLMANVRWVVSELLRLYWSGSRADVARVVREIVRYQVPAVMKLDNRDLVLRTDCTVEEEILILLHNVGEEGMTRTLLGDSVPKPPPRVSEALARLKAADKRQVVERTDGTLALTPNGSKRIHDELAEKLTLG